MANNVPVLMQWGPLQFQVFPLNFHELDHSTETEWAKKDVMESSPQRENVGEGDELISIRGRLFPWHSYVPMSRGSRSSIERFDAMRRDGQAHQLIRGGNREGFVLGWFVCERLTRQHTSIGPDGYGKIVNFDAQFARVDVPMPDDYFLQIYRTTRA